MKRFLCLTLVAVCACSVNHVVEDADTNEDMASAPMQTDGSVMDFSAVDGSVSDGAVDAGMCLPDLAPSIACGRCGSAALSCVAGNVTTGACMGEHGACAATETITDAAGCLIKRCAADCSAWSMWMLKPPAQCSFGTMETGSCDAGPGCPHAGTRKCISGCKWGPCQCI